MRFISLILVLIMIVFMIDKPDDYSSADYLTDSDYLEQQETVCRDYRRAFNDC